MSETETAIVPAPTASFALPEQVKEKEGILSWEWPGQLNYATSTGAYTGCQMMAFVSTDEMNAFGKENSKLLMVDWRINEHMILALFTKRLDNDEMEELDAFSRFAEQHMKEWRQERAESRRKEREAEAARKEETERLSMKGAKCEKDHGGLDKVKQQIRELKKRIRELGGEVVDANE